MFLYPSVFFRIHQIQCSLKFCDETNSVTIKNLCRLEFCVTQIAQFRYFKIQRKTIDITTRLRGINPTNSIVYSLEPRAEVYRLTLNFKISKLGYFVLHQHASLLP